MPQPPSIHAEASEDRALFYRRVALAPLCLCLVAGLHAYRVTTAGQTPWKGGGFGMFSTVDAESARYLRCYLVGSDGEALSILIPQALEKRAAELRAAPSLDGAEQLAERLARRQWTLPAMDRLAQASFIRSAASQGALTSKQLRHCNVAEFARIQTPRRRIVDSDASEFCVPAERPAGLPLAAEAMEPHAEQGTSIQYEAIRVEVWKYGFDETTCQLAGHRLLAVTQPRAKVAEAQP